MSSGESGKHWFLQGDDPSKQQTSPPPGPQQGYQSSNASMNPFNKLAGSPLPQDGSTYSPPPPGYAQQQYPTPQGSPYPPPQQGSPFSQQQGSPYPQQQGGPFTPSQFPPQQSSPFPQQAYSQSGPYPPPQQGYPQQGYNQQRQYPEPNSQTSGEASSFYGSGPPVPIQSGGPDQRGFFDNAMQIAGVQQPTPGPDGLERGWFSSSKNPLDPPPNMFKRTAPAHYAYIQFMPMSILAVSDRLQDGFALIPPVTSPGDQHPFLSHDITEEDWHKFLKDFQKTAHLSPSDRLFQSMANSFMKDKIPSDKVQKRMAENKLEPIGDYLMAWNHYFFRPRRMSVVLAKGEQRFSGETDDYPPDINRKVKKASKDKKKEKKSSHTTRSSDVPLVNLAEPYPQGSILGGLLNPVHKVLYDAHKSVTDATLAVATAPSDLLLGTRSGVPQKPKSKARSDSEDSDSSSSSSSSDTDDRRHGRKRGDNFDRFGGRGRLDDIRARREERLEEMREGRRDRMERMEERREGRKERREERKEKKGKHGGVHQSDGTTGVPLSGTKFRLVVCYWDGQREVY